MYPNNHQFTNRPNATTETWPEKMNRSICNGKRATRGRGGRGTATDGSAVPSEADPPAAPDSATARAMADPAADGDTCSRRANSNCQQGDRGGHRGRPAGPGRESDAVGTESPPKKMARTAPGRTRRGASRSVPT
ncbi:hypothetical protein THAOC_20841 [Thalassiosira oceanica]|uniref:Uncharacterized protein n=1 Tax=Thalassiosira oceanica TaxID=159749 RepID=K0S2D2_THAOC|nr:hypothetical protein THAOC_20841 [Thalassiosira oceanica]|eukprot:EJK58994.1 hypothetical protein THAOC_20841 [Thalassiosira oceanica]